MITRSHVGDLVSDPLDHAGRLMSQHCRCRVGIGAVEEDQVAVAEPGCNDSHQNLSRVEIGDLHVFDAHGLAHRAHDCGLQWTPFSQDRWRLYEITSPNMPSINEYLAGARARIDRVLPDHLDDEMDAGALVVDIRPEADREAFGELDGAVVIERNVLEWRLAPSSDTKTFDVSDGRRVILFCNDGYQSSLAAAALRDLGVAGAGDVIGGYNAYRALKE